MLLLRAETLVVSNMDTLKNAALDALMRSLPPSLTQLDLEHCLHIGRLSCLAALPKLEELILRDCRTLHTLPERGWGALASIEKIDLFGCGKLKDEAIANIVHGMASWQLDQVMLRMPDGKIFMDTSADA